MSQKSSDRPLAVTILAVFVLCITSWNGIRIYSVLVNWQVLRDFDANPVYILGTGLFWALAGLGLFWLFWEGRQFAFQAGWGAAGLYLIWYWLDRLVVQPSPATNVGFSVVASAVMFAIFTLGLLLPSSRAFFASTGAFPGTGTGEGPGANIKRRQNERENQEDSGPS
jgi:hypothetical protein